MFRIVCDPSSGSIELYLTEIRSGSLMFVVCLVGVWQRNFLTCGVCVRYDGLQPVVPYIHILSTQYSCQFSIKLEYSRHISEKSSNVKFPENCPLEA